MLPHEFEPFISEANRAEAVLESFELSLEFSREVRHREAFEQYCQWYYQTADTHRRELAQMRGDLNIFGLFGFFR
ncbi:hypothetical protein [Synechococcus sp. PCC 7336]|uniref:hypothetical protein n=1 Tax=Synechococcus sp. PCC 7336 TaxID=195250 RepID=UPI0003487AD7|nr:hypothetical protein [Synechococcus sp. PCC 7336]